MKRIGICPGDPSGIGYEITAKSLNHPDIQNELSVYDIIAVIYASKDLWQKAASLFTPELKYKVIDTPQHANDKNCTYIIDSGVNVDNFTPGQLSAKCANCAYSALMKCSDDVKKGLISGICTGPIHKGAMRLAGISDRSW